MASNPGGAVLGTLIVAALLAAENAKSETYPETVGGVLITLLVYWLAHSYAEVTARRLREQHALTLKGLVETMRHELTIMVGALVPLITLLAWWVTGGALGNGLTAGVWTAVGVVVITEFVVGVRADLKPRELAMQTAFGATLGILVIVLRVVVH